MNPLGWLTKLLSPDVQKETGGMDRRAFLKVLGGTAAVVAAAPMLDLERLLWVPGEKTIFLPYEGPFGNQIVTVDWITREALRILENNLKMASVFNREYDAKFQLIPHATVGKDGLTRQRIIDVDHDVLTMKRADARTRILEPVAANLAHSVQMNQQTRFGTPMVLRGVDHCAVVTNPSTGISVRGVSGYDLVGDRMRLTLDIVTG